MCVLVVFRPAGRCLLIGASSMVGVDVQWSDARCDVIPIGKMVDVEVFYMQSMCDIM